VDQPEAAILASLHRQRMRDYADPATVERHEGRGMHRPLFRLSEDIAHTQALQEL
jgi:hypothetical protein